MGDDGEWMEGKGEGIWRGKADSGNGASVRWRRRGCGVRGDGEGRWRGGDVERRGSGRAEWRKCEREEGRGRERPAEGEGESFQIYKQLLDLREIEKRFYTAIVLFRKPIKMS